MLGQREKLRTIFLLTLSPGSPCGPGRPTGPFRP